MIKRVFSKIRNLNKKPIQRIESEYLDFLAFANAGMLHDGNRYCFEYVIKNLPSNSPIIEIGSFCGLSTNVITYLLRKHKRENKLITSDKWVFEGAEQGNNLGDSELTHADFREFVIGTFKRNLNFFSGSNLPYPIEVFSDEFFGLWNSGNSVKDIFNRDVQLGGAISFAYIDGNHSYEYAKRDFENSAKYLEKGGFILFDDSSEYSKFGCAELMKEILKNDNFELVLKNPNYLFKKVK